MSYSFVVAAAIIFSQLQHTESDAFAKFSTVSVTTADQEYEYTRTGQTSIAFASYKTYPLRILGSRRPRLDPGLGLLMSQLFSEFSTRVEIKMYIYIAEHFLHTRKYLRFMAIINALACFFHLMTGFV